MLRKLHSAVGIIRTVKNWPLALLDHAGLLKRPYICRIRNGPRLRLRGGTDDHHVMFEIFVHGCYRAADICPGAVVIDIGANIGCYSLLTARNAARVLAYEPYPENVSALRENVALNRTSNVQIFPYAVAATAGEAILFIPDDDAFVGRISLYAGRGTRTTQTTRVTLDQIVHDAGLDRIDVLKIDCQGAEYEILYGASPETLSCVRQIITECERFDDRPSWSISALKSYLQNCKFNVHTHQNLLYAYR